MDDGGVVTPLGVVEDSKISGEKPPVEVHYTQDKTQEQFRRQTSLITQAEFLFYIQIQCVNYIRQDTLYIGESDLGSKSERGRGVICEKPSRR